MLGLETCLDRKPKALSGGQRQRVALGRAIVRQPKVFLFDEPLSNLDAKMRVSTRAEISKLHARLGATMIYVTHDQAEAMTMGDRICVIRDGNILQVDDPLTLYHQPVNLFVAGFIGSPAMNFFRGTVQRGGDHLAFVETNTHAVPIRVRLDERLSSRASGHLDSPLILGIRPEDLSDLQSDPDSDPAPSIEATLEVIEPMGAETFLHLFTGATSFIARVRPAHGLTVNRKVRVAIDLAKAHLFDAATEQVLK
jgi:multiple sugar transport system ATP-binding protein